MSSSPRPYAYAKVINFIQNPNHNPQTQHPADQAVAGRSAAVPPPDNEVPEPRLRVFSFGFDAGSLAGDATPPDRERDRHRHSVWSTVSAYGGYCNYALNFAPASTVIVLIQTILYFWNESMFGIGSEEDVRVSWEKVIQEGEYNRLLVAHLCHFTWYHLLFNAIGLMQIGRYIERKFKIAFTIAIIELMGILANLLYCITTKSLDYSDATSIHGFSHVFYGLRMFVAYCQEPRNYEPGLFLGLYPAYLSSTWAPWQPALEIFLLKLIVSEMNVCGHCSGFIVGFIFAFLILLIPKSIQRRRSRHLLLESQAQEQSQPS